MHLTAFLARYIEGYLFADLDTMSTAGPKGPRGPPPGDGYVGYPMVASCASGIEVLGRLAAPINNEKPYERFVRYWKSYLYTVAPRRDAGMVVYQLARHGIAHNFAAKAAFEITKAGDATRHLVSRTDGTTLLDAVQLFKDLRDSYFANFKPVATGAQPGRIGETPATMQLRLDELLAENTNSWVAHGAALRALPAEPAPPSVGGTGSLYTPPPPQPSPPPGAGGTVVVPAPGASGPVITTPATSKPTT